MEHLHTPLIKVELPLAPATNNLYFIRGGRKVLSNEGREYKKKVGKIITNKFVVDAIPTGTSLCFAATFYIPSTSFSKRDLDNCLKCTIDAIFGAFKDMGSEANDNQITELHVQKKLAHLAEPNGSCIVGLLTCEGEE